MKNRNLEHKNDWKTPADFYSLLDSVFKFTFDPCPFQHDLNLWNGLEIEWKESNFINPPYERTAKERFIRKAYQESLKGKLSVILLPVSTSTVIFHEIIKPNAQVIEFKRNRLCFSGWNSEGEWVDNRTGMHDSMVTIFNHEWREDFGNLYELINRI